MVNRSDKRLGFAVLGGVILLILLAILVTAGGSGGHVSRKSVAVVEIVGVIADSEPVVELLEQYMKNDRIPAIVLRLDTPGGAVAPSQEIYATVLKARKHGKKVVGSMGTVAASGGYYIAAACDTVVANPGTITGSIGVIADFAEFSRLLEKLGVEFTVVKTGKYKDTGSFSRAMTDDEKELIRAVLMDTYDQFVDAVAEGRRMNRETVLKYADGRVFTGRQAKELGFVDLTGTYQDAVDLAGRMTGLGDDPPVVREEDGRLWETLLREMSNVLAKGLDAGAPPVSYRMQ